MLNKLKLFFKQTTCRHIYKVVETELLGEYTITISEIKVGERTCTAITKKCLICGKKIIYEEIKDIRKYD